MNNHELHAYCEQWRVWCITRKYFIAPGGGSILGQMQQHPVREAPDALMSEDLSFFNSAIHSLVDMGESGAKCFVDFYFHRVRNIKAQARDMEISRDTYYDRKMRFARKALALSVSLRNMYAQSRPAAVDLAQSGD